jgi:hypothetical protein
MAITRLIVASSLVLVACAGDASIDPSALELRDVLGMAPHAAQTWTPRQRAAARDVIEAGLQPSDAAPTRAQLAPAQAPDVAVASALAAVDLDRMHHGSGALGLVHVAATGDGAVVMTPHATTLAPHHTPAVAIQLAGWDDDPVLTELVTRGSDLLPALASDAGHTTGPLVVLPAPRLQSVAVYVAAAGEQPAQLVVNPVVLAALEPVSSGVASAMIAAIAGGPPPMWPVGSGSGSMARPPTPPSSSGGNSGLSQAVQTGCDAADGCDCSGSDDDSSDSSDGGGCDSCGGDDDGDDSGCGDCSSGDGGDCGGDGGDCSGGGGDCSGGDCNAAGRRGPHGRVAVAPAVGWAVLPLLVGTFIKRRARRRRASEGTQPS